MKKQRSRNRGGFSLMEVLISMLMLTVGLVGMAGATTYYFMQVRVAGMRAERMAAVQQMVERLHATPFDSLKDKSSSAADQVGRFRIWWTTSSPSRDLRQIALYSRGPSWEPGTGWTTAAEDTLQLSIARGRGE